mgnify:CR=1 FL=1
MKILRKIIEIDEDLCTGCGECVPACAEGALRIVDGKARMIADKYCDGLGACLGECPVGALKIIEREADDFDEEAVEELLASQKAEAVKQQSMACGCPSAQLKSFAPTSPCQTANQPKGIGGEGSALTHWPVQIRLVPPSAPFLKEADLLIAADCVPVAYPAFHAGMLAGKTVMLGCPKFDDAESYVAKFSEIFATANLNSITIAIMEVPCCGTMRGIVREALKRSGKQIAVREVVVSAQGQILRDAPMEA